MKKTLAEVPGLTPRIVKMLAKENIACVADVVQMLPFRHEDRRRMDALAFQAADTAGCHFVRVAMTHVKFFGPRRGAGVFEAVVEHVDDNVLGQQLTLRWWNMPFMSKSIATDMELVVYGRIKEFKGKLFMDHPEHEIIRGGEDDEGATIHTGRITPVYRLRGGLTQKAVRTAAWHVMEMLDDRFVDDLLPLPSDKGEYAGWHRSRALHTVHFPATAEELAQASRYLALEEFYGFQIRVVRRRRRMIEAGGKAHKGDGHLLEEFLRELPFEMTGAQKRSLGEIRRDMASAAPMNRLLHGDVGSGKTVVALAAMLTAIESGSQAALMAPTQILAEQHFLTAQKWLSPLDVRVRLMLGSGAGSTGGPPVELGGPPSSSSASEHVHENRGATDVSRSAANAPAARPDASSMESRTEGGRAVVSLRDEFGGPPNSTGAPPVLPGSHPLRGISETTYSKRNLPHFERPWGKYMVTFSTRDRMQLSPASRDSVLACILHWKDQRYRLYAACVMPDHAHILIEPMIAGHDDPGKPTFFPLKQIMHTIKSFTAHEINRMEQTRGPVWETENVDYLIRSESDLQEKFAYITRNPWDASIVKPDEGYAWVWHPQCLSEQRSRPGSTGGPPVELGGPPSSSSASEHAHENRGASDVPRSAANAPAARPDASSMESRTEGGRAVVSLRDEFGGPPNSTGGPPVLPNAAAALRALPEILIGTHALLYDRAAMHNLGLVVIDEQHRFGVAQRARLIEKGNTPDVLVMTATPIPRTLTLTIYGDLDVSTIDERPKARGKIITKVRPQKKIEEAAAFLRGQIDQGRQGFLVFPLIEDSEKLDAAAAKKGHEQWSGLLEPHSVGLLHGKLSAEEKERVMREFREGKTSALVSTTVIEVGVDVPNATVMYVHNAERFGLAQLHQLRGRIGRGSHTSYCVLFIKEEDEETKRRLAILEETDDGFLIAEEDLRRRGPGDVLGRAQSGQAPLRFAELLADTRLVRLARQLAERTLDQDPDLSGPQHAALRQIAIEADSPQAMLQ